MPKRFLSRVLADYGVLLPLALLCTFFSVATLNEQYPTGEAAARQVAAMIDRSARVVIVVRDHPEDVEFAERLQAEIAKSNVVAVVRGEPKDVRETLRQLKEQIDVVACTPQTAGWHSLADLSAAYPALGNPRIVQPTPYLWPDFLKPANLRNVASQISIIAVIAIGMTLVIITGGIDLSVGSLIALSSVVAASLMRDLFGGKNAVPLDMVAACAVAVLLCAGVGLCTGTVIRCFDVPPFIVTLGMLLVGGGLAGVISQDQSINDVPSSFAWLGRGADLFDVPNAVVLMIVLYALAHVLMLNVKSRPQTIVLGCVILAAVVFDSVRRRR